MASVNDEILQIFFQECQEQLPVLENGLSSLDSGDYDPETVNAVFRAVHSIKGGRLPSGWSVWSGSPILLRVRWIVFVQRLSSQPPRSCGSSSNPWTCSATW
ncbi:Hpt domain-containing protein [Acetobacter persici]|uniref:Hpt domain-containing protein n=1 Tax=Acetobacter persici TaxID=1076596 RepID=UPI001FCC43BF|nr:Hpt domain-containing protein [Acetobacter persici]